MPRAIPRWFQRELKFIDPDLYVIYDGEANTFDIYKDVEKQFGKRRWIETRMIEVFRHLNDAALTQLRYRKYLGRKYETPENQNRYFAQMSREAREKKAKIHEENIDQISESIMTAYNAQTKQHFHK